MSSKVNSVSIDSILSLIGENEDPYSSAEHLSDAFVWCETTEGPDYWSKIRDDLEAGKRLPRKAIRKLALLARGKLRERS